MLIRRAAEAPHIIDVMDQYAQAQKAGNVPASALIYLVNPDLLIAQDMAMQLRGAGYTVVTLPGLGQLDAEISRCTPAMVIIDSESDHDIDVAAIDLAALRARSGRNFPIVRVSPLGGFKTRLAAARAGADAYFTRPLDFVSMLDQLRTLLRVREIRAYRVLIIAEACQQTQDYAHLLQSAGMQIRLLDKLAGLFAALDDYRPELVLIDFELPGCAGSDLARLVRQNRSYLDIPIIAMANNNSEHPERANTGWSGVDAVIAKPVAPGHFVVCIAGVAERYYTLRALILRDSLTGLYNHAAIKEQLAHELPRSERSSTVLSLAMIDIDFFKKVNDTYGHPVGDQVICALSRLLQKRLRGSDIIGRYGGEEFAVILPGTDAAAAVATLEEVRILFEAISHRSGDEKFISTFSAGVADTTLHRDVDALFKAADTALYAAKREGRNCIRRALDSETCSVYQNA